MSPTFREYAMNKLLTHILVFHLTCLVTSCSLSQRVDANSKHLPPSERTLSGRSSIFTCQLHLVKSPFPSATEEWWGVLSTTNRRSIYIIASADVRIRRKRIVLPVSAYSGIANPEAVYMRSLPKGFLLQIKGGEAASSYSCTMTFHKKADDYLLVRKEVHHGELPESNEVTVYHYADTL